jgi:hypothetical protein
MIPTIFTMFVSGLWHGAGYGFICWGLIHGIFLSINHGWRVITGRLWTDKAAYDRVMGPAGQALTFASASATMVFFRAPTLSSALDLVRGIFGFNGVALPQVAFDKLGFLAGTFHSMGISIETWGSDVFVKTAFWTFVLMFIALVCPNTLQVLSRHEPALGVRQRQTRPVGGFVILEWTPSIPWAVVVSCIAGIAIFFLGGPSEFLYWQF